MQPHAIQLHTVSLVSRPTATGLKQTSLTVHYCFYILNKLGNRTFKISFY